MHVACELAPFRRASRRTTGGGCGNGREPPRARAPVEVCPCVLSKCEAVSVVTWKHPEQAHVQNIWKKQSHSHLIYDNLSA